jgi:hypothetical protein
VVAQAAYRATDANDRGRPLPVWHKGTDGELDAVIGFARVLLTEAEIQSAIDRQVGGIQLLIELLEQKMLIAIDRRISGAATAEVAR